jgi:GNAT superfamily N-acetyltransferase
MCLTYYSEDPGLAPVTEAQIRLTLDALRRQPHRGQAVVLEVDGSAAGYALLIPFWSNEYGGEVCEVDELFVAPSHRGRGLGSALFDAVERGEIGRTPAVAIALGVTRNNQRARRLYERLGFVETGVGLMRPIPRP